MAGATLGSVIWLPQTRPGDEDHGGDRRSEDFNGKSDLEMSAKAFADLRIPFHQNRHSVLIRYVGL